MVCSPQLSAAEAQQVYYGNSTTTRLQNIKSQVDPKNTFSFPQAIENAVVPEGTGQGTGHSAARRGATPYATQLGVVAALLLDVLFRVV